MRGTVATDQEVRRSTRNTITKVHAIAEHLAILVFLKVRRFLDQEFANAILLYVKVYMSDSIR